MDINLLPLRYIADYFSQFIVLWLWWYSELERYSGKANRPVCSPLPGPVQDQVWYEHAFGPLLCPSAKLHTFLMEVSYPPCCEIRGALPRVFLDTSHPQCLLPMWFDILDFYLFIHILFQLNCRFLEKRNFDSGKLLLRTVSPVPCGHRVGGQ